MNRLSIILRIVALIAALSSALIFFTARSSLATKAKEVALAELANEAVIKELEVAAGDITTLEERIKSERAALVEAKSSLGATQATLQRTNQEASLTLEKLQRAEQTILSQQSELFDLRDKLLLAERRNSAASQNREIEILEASIDTLNEKNKALNEQINLERARLASIEKMQASGKENLGRLIDPNYQPTKGTVSAQTEIASINRANRIIVFSARPVLELKVGHEIQLHSERELLGKVRVFKVTDTYTVATLLPDFDAKRIDAGSIVTIIR
jgi:chromosome segregation ATPase